MQHCKHALRPATALSAEDALSMLLARASAHLPVHHLQCSPWGHKGFIVIDSCMMENFADDVMRMRMRMLLAGAPPPCRLVRHLHCSPGDA